MKNDKQKREDEIEITFHEMKACLVFREEDEASGFIPVPVQPLHVKKEYSFTTTKEEINGEDIFAFLKKMAEESILLGLMQDKEMFDLSIPKIVYLDCTINGERKVFDEWPKMKCTDDEED